jgi:hypothetical protein
VEAVAQQHLPRVVAHAVAAEVALRHQLTGAVYHGEVLCLRKAGLGLEAEHHRTTGADRAAFQPTAPRAAIERSHSRVAAAHTAAKAHVRRWRADVPLLELVAGAPGQPYCRGQHWRRLLHHHLLCEHGLGNLRLHRLLLVHDRLRRRLHYDNLLRLRRRTLLDGPLDCPLGRTHQRATEHRRPLSDTTRDSLLIFRQFDGGHTVCSDLPPKLSGYDLTGTLLLERLPEGLCFISHIIHMA